MTLVAAASRKRVPFPRYGLYAGAYMGRRQFLVKLRQHESLPRIDSAI